MASVTDADVSPASVPARRFADGEGPHEGQAEHAEHSAAHRVVDQLLKQGVRERDRARRGEPDGDQRQRGDERRAGEAERHGGQAGRDRAAEEPRSARRQEVPERDRERAADRSPAADGEEPPQPGCVETQAVADDDRKQRGVRHREQADEGGDRQERLDPRASAHVPESLDDAVPHRSRIRDRARGNPDQHERDDRPQVRERVDPEAAGQADRPERQSGHARAHDPRQVELGGVQRDGVLEVPAIDEVVEERLKGGRRERDRGAARQREREDVPDLNGAGPRQRGQHRGARHHSEVGPATQACWHFFRPVSSEPREMSGSPLSP